MDFRLDNDRSAWEQADVVSANLHCPDTITLIQVRVSAPFFYDNIIAKALKRKIEIIMANQSRNR
jgi:hypothetical protein